MEINPLHISGSSILPLPPINGDTSTIPALPARLIRDFSFELAEQIEKTRQFDFFPSGNSTEIKTAAAQPSLSDEESENLMQVCKELEGFLLSMLLKSMGDSVSEGGVFGSSYESSIYKDMFFDELANSVGNDGPGFGIAQTLYNDIIMKAGGGVSGIDLTA